VGRGHPHPGPLPEGEGETDGSRLDDLRGLSGGRVVAGLRRARSDAPYLVKDDKMFTGIVEETGVVTRIERGAKSIRLSVATKVTAKGAKIGDSLAVNGCCLTIVAIKRGKEFTFDLLEETWERTNFKALKVGSAVNLERSLAAGDRLHGHFVTGHVDGTGVIEKLEKRGKDWLLKIRPPAGLLRYIVFKGAIAVDGISLTVAEVSKRSFRIWIIPHTYDVTALRERKVGALVNLEADMLAKYVERLAKSR
jgi:riboflavin synthase